MARFKVVLQGVLNNSPEGWAAFCRHFAEAYQMDLDRAMSHIESHEHCLYSCEDEEAAVKAVDFLEKIGGISTVIKEDQAPAVRSDPSGPLRKCMYCGASAEASARACPHCSRPFPIKAQVDKMDPRARENLRIEKEGLTGKSRCLYCGETFDRGRQIVQCPHCGRKVQNAGYQARDEATQLAGIVKALTDD